MPAPSTERQTTATTLEKAPRRHRRRDTAGQSHERLRALQAAVDSARETLAATEEQARLTKARLTTLLHEVKEARGKLKAHAREVRRHARALSLALKALGGHQRQATSSRR
jgi:predicted  nucleic acid-binding Zn-ribbon protein